MYYLMTTTLSILVGLMSSVSFGQESSGQSNTERNRFYATVGTEWFLSHASFYRTLGVYVSDKHAIELRQEHTHAMGSFEGRTARLKSFWSGKSFYTAMGIHSYSSDIGVEVESDGADMEKKYESRSAMSIGPHAAVGAQWHLGYLALGVEYCSVYYAALYVVEGEAAGAASKNAVDRSKRGYELNWPIHTPQIFIGLVF